METRVEIEYNCNKRAYITSRTDDGFQEITRRFSRDLTEEDYATIDSLVKAGKVLGEEGNTRYVLPFDQVRRDMLLDRE